MTEFEEKQLEYIKKQHEEHLKYLKQKDEEYLNFIRRCEIESRIKEEEFDKGCRQYSFALLVILVIGFSIVLLCALPCCC